MGYTYATVKVCNPRELSRSFKVRLLVDTGSTYTWIKRSKLEKIGVYPSDRRRFKTINNKVIERDIGEAVVECLGKRATTVVVFAEESDHEVLGLHALEGLGLEVDPVSRQLREIEVILAI
ncbi:MAG: hypothetical protein DRJ63_04670 [Thermoprotei archaeon]|nr:MAG: hypothetical protein DRJ63_04670 [Thermoprotei archaeon]